MSAIETPLFNDDPSRITITPTLAIFGGATYPIKHISSVSARVNNPGRAIPFSLIAVGVTMLALTVLMGLAALFYEDSSGLFGIGSCGALGFWIFLTGIVVWYSGKTSYEIRISHTGGEVRVFTSVDRVLIQSIVHAINQAIVQRA